MKTTWDELMRYAPEKEYPLPALERGEQERILNKTMKKLEKTKKRPARPVRTALLVLMGAVMPNQVLATELFRLTWLGRQDAAVLAMGLVLVMILLRVLTALKWRGEREEENCRYNWW